jgi:hypothetical protein
LIGRDIKEIATQSEAAREERSGHPRRSFGSPANAQLIVGVVPVPKRAPAASSGWALPAAGRRRAVAPSSGLPPAASCATATNVMSVRTHPKAKTGFDAVSSVHYSAAMCSDEKFVGNFRQRPSLREDVRHRQFVPHARSAPESRSVPPQKTCKRAILVPRFLQDASLAQAISTLFTTTSAGAWKPR